MKYQAACVCAIAMLWSLAAFGTPNPADLAAYKAAGAQLVILIQAAQEKGDISQLKTPKGLSLVKSVSNEERILRPGSYTSAELGDETCEGLCAVR